MRREQNHSTARPHISRRRMSFKERIILTVSVIGALALCTVMVLHVKLIPADAGGYTARISLLEKFRQWQPFLEADGALESKDYDLRLKTDAAETRPQPENSIPDLSTVVEGQFTVLFLGMDETRSNTDVIMLALFDLRENCVQILQIPRDTFVPGFTSFEACKLNSVYARGNPKRPPVQRVVDCLEAIFRIPIDRYVCASCGDIAEIVDLIGGVPVDMPYRINYETGKVIEAGEQVLSGEQAEWLVRFRHDYTEGDIGRMKAQRIFLAAAMRKMSSLGAAELLRAVDQIEDRQLIGSDLTVDELTKLAALASAAGTQRITMHLLPGEGTRYAPPLPQNDIPYYSVWTMHRQPVIDLLNQHFRPYTAAEDDLPVAELLTPDRYQCTKYDSDCTDFQSIAEEQQFIG